MNSSKESYKFSELVRDAWPYIRPYQKKFFGATFLRLSGDIATLYLAYGFASVVTFISTYQVGQSLDVLYKIIIGLFAAMFWTTTAVWYAKYVVFKMAEKVAADVKLAAIRHLFALDLAWHEKENTGNKVKRIDRGGDSLNQLLRIWIQNLIEISVNFIGMLFIIGRVDWQISAALLIYLAFYFYVSRIFTRQAATASLHVNEREEDFSGLLYQGASNIRTVKSLGAAESFLKLFRQESNRVMAAVSRRILFYQSRGGTLGLMSGVFRWAGLAFIIFGIIAGHYEIGFLVLFNGYYSSLQISSRELADSAQDYVIYKQAFARVARLLREPINIASPEGKVSFPVDWQTIKFKNVSFDYGHESVLSNISFTINRGEKVGIVGLSGAGKSTLMKLLLKEYEPTQGQILFDEVALKDVSSNKYLQKIAVVFQETEVFNLSLRDNVAIIDPQKIDDALLQRAIDVSHVTDFLSKLPEGELTAIGEKGVRLSGGEKQRLGIARAIYKSPQILLLDEATSHLDLESEQKIQDSLHQFFQSVTAVVIAHRLTTIKEMDKILVVERGQIIESGSFEELMSQAGRFAELWDKQKL
jgi:ABC-type multidrug transport system fused ATPase/permease subunit